MINKLNHFLLFSGQRNEIYAHATMSQAEQINCVEDDSGWKRAQEHCHEFIYSFVN